MGLLQPSLYRSYQNNTVGNEMQLFGVNNNNNNNNTIPITDKLQNVFTKKIRRIKH